MTVTVESSSRRQTKIKKVQFLLAPTGGEENVAAPRSASDRAAAKPYSPGSSPASSREARRPMLPRHMAARRAPMADASGEVRPRRAVRYHVSCHHVRCGSHIAIPPVTSPLARHTFGCWGKSEGQGSKGRGTPIRSPSPAVSRVPVACHLAVPRSCCPGPYYRRPARLLGC